MGLPVNAIPPIDPTVAEALAETSVEAQHRMHERGRVVLANATLDEVEEHLHRGDISGPVAVAARADAERQANELQAAVREQGANLVYDHLRAQGRRKLPTRAERELIALALDAGMAATLNYLTRKGTIES